MGPMDLWLDAELRDAVQEGLDEMLRVRGMLPAWTRYLADDLADLGIVALWQESISLPQRVERIDHIDQFDVCLLLLQSLEYRLCGDCLSQASHMNVAGRSDAGGDQLRVRLRQQVLGDDVRPVHVISRPQQHRALLTLPMGQYRLRMTEPISGIHCSSLD